MITGIGIDIVDIRRMEHWKNNMKLMERYFNPDELSYILSQKSALSLAARFAVKEAFGKALGTGLTNIVLKDIMVINQDNGKPELCLTGTARNAMEKTGADKAHISLSHERDNAIALVILEKV
ncbi:MAG: holo-ACP synthase [Treponema sp.]|jgi:holo-[acyl-carrier protein] synthase|nr:holo-ACP synthase [Treponema sp.]